MIHYHGTPLTPQEHFITAFAGRFACVSFSDFGRERVDLALHLCQGVMWDSGAFTIWRSGQGALDVRAYYDWLEPRISPVHWAVVPDVIGGDDREQRELIRSWPFRKDYGAAVWHMGLPIYYLLELADTWPRICFGSSAEYAVVGSEPWERRCDEAFNALARRHRWLPWIHMLRGMDLNGTRWPFASTDSAVVARNYRRDRRDPKTWIGELDSIQNPIRWHERPEQPGLFEGGSRVDEGRCGGSFESGSDHAETCEITG